MSEPVRHSEICPRCEEGILITREVPQDIVLQGSLVRLPDVQVEQCPVCGFQSLSGREVALFEVLFAPAYSRVADLIAALRASRYYSAFLREDESTSRLGFGSRSYVTGLQQELRNLYLDNESAHIIRGLNAVQSGVVPFELGESQLTVKLPKLGEGENGIVYDYQERPDAVLKIAKPRAYSRDHLNEEYKVTDFYIRQGIPVPRILQADVYGSFMIKERLAGEPLSKVHPTLGGPEDPRHRQVRSAVQAFIARLIEMFRAYPETKTSISPNNIFVLCSANACQCLLVDTGPAPMHDYSKFDFSEYWDVVVPQKIRQYKAVGYL